MPSSGGGGRSSLSPPTHPPPSHNTAILLAIFLVIRGGRGAAGCGPPALADVPYRGNKQGRQTRSATTCATDNTTLSLLNALIHESKQQAALPLVHGLTPLAEHSLTPHVNK